MTIFPTKAIFDGKRRLRVRQRHAARKRFLRRPLHGEFLEDRRLLTTFVVNGTNGNDFIVFDDSGPDLIASIYNHDTNVVISTQQMPLSDVTSVEIHGGDGDDEIHATDVVPNTMYGGAGSDYLRGGSNVDTLYGEGDNDALEGYGGDDFLYGGSGDDGLFGDEGDDLLDGGAGDDGIYPGAGMNKVLPGSGNDIYDLSENEVAVTFTESGVGDDTVYGTAFNDVIHLGGGDDHFYPCRFCDWSVESHGNDKIYGDEGNDTIHASAAASMLFGGAGNDRLLGGSAGDTLEGGDDNDELVGGAGNDTLRGGAGDDAMLGEDGDDQLEGGDGHDIYFIGRSSENKSGHVDTLVENPDEGEDEINVQGYWVPETADTKVDLSEGQVQQLGNGVIVLQTGYSAKGVGQNFEWVTTSSGDDIVTGNARNNRIDTGDGDDLIWGYAGSDVLIGGLGSDQLEAQDVGNLLIGDKLQFGNGVGGQPTADQIDTLLTKLQGGVLDTPFPLSIVGPDDATSEDTLRLPSTQQIQSGSSILIGGPGGDVFEQITGVWNIIFGDSFLTPGGYQYDFQTAITSAQSLDELRDKGQMLLDSTISFMHAGEDTITGGTSTIVFAGAGSDRFISATNGNDLVFGESGDDVLEGGPGNDVLDGGRGNDMLAGEHGDDLLIGGKDDDRYVFGDTASGSDELREDIGTNNDSNDTLDFTEFTTSFYLDLSDTNVQVVSSADPMLSLTLSTATGLEDVLGSDFDDVIFGNSRDNAISAGAGNDLIFGEGSHSSRGDILLGEDDDDVIFGDGFNIGAADKQSLGAGLLSLLGAGTLFQLSAGLQPISGTKNTIFGGDGDDVIIGGTSEDTIEAGAGNALIFGDSFSTAVAVNVSVADLWSSPQLIADLFKTTTQFQSRCARNVENSRHRLGCCSPRRWSLGW